MDAPCPGLRKLSLGAVFASGNIQVWVLDLPVLKLLPDTIELLSKNERQHLEKIRSIPRGNRFVLSRFALRSLFSAELGCAADKVKFGEGMYGKPYLLTPLSDLQFNISYCGNLAVIALSKNCPVGVDIEAIHPNLEFSDIGKEVFTVRELEQLSSLGVQQKARTFWHLWTKKEAVLKMLETGFQQDPRSIELDVHALVQKIRFSSEESSVLSRHSVSVMRLPLSRYSHVASLAFST